MTLHKNLHINGGGVSHISYAFWTAPDIPFWMKAQVQRVRWGNLRTNTPAHDQNPTSGISPTCPLRDVQSLTPLPTEPVDANTVS